MPPAGEQPERPDYKVYRSRPGLLGRLRKPEAAKLERPRLPRRDRDRDRGRSDRGTLKPPGRRRWLRIALYAIGAWILLSVIVFAVSAQLQKSKLPDSAQKAIHWNPMLLTEGQNILVIGTDVRPEGSKEAGAQTLGTESCPNVARCANTRADTLMLVRAGGGAFRKLSIPRDSFAEIPGQGAQKINGAYAFGGVALQVRTVENFLGIDVDHVMVVDFTGFQDMIDAVGGVKVRLRKRVCAEISGGGRNGGVTLRLTGGEHTLNGRQALALARARKNTCAQNFDDRDRAENQQRILSGIKGRLTSPFRLPYNFIRGPWIAWAAPRTMVSDLGPLTMPQLVLAAVIGGDEKPSLLVPSGFGPGGSLVISDQERRRKVRKLLR
jgi:LCP family protein required for cell wall assembly